MRAGFLLDTNHLSHALRPVSHAREGILERRAKGIVLGTCVPVLCEVEVGLAHHARRDELRGRLQHLLRHVRVWPIEMETARQYGAVAAELRRKGKALSQVDMMLAALARQMRVALVTTDPDFEALPDIPAESWLARDD
ncbi:MAG TPA: type II toxin-antitoxin system VapC family toxin [Humisphaera sp.]